jgi:Ca2+-binding EF-hand superfamily protein
MPDEPVDPLQLMTVFRCFDTDRSGGISLQEMQAAAKTVGGISMKDGVSER